MKKFILLLSVLLGILLTGCEDESESTPKMEQVVDSSLKFVNSEYAYIKSFDITGDGIEAQLSINYRSDDYEVFLFDDVNYLKFDAWLNGDHNSVPNAINGLSSSIRSDYTSPWVSLPRGTYHLVFDNTSFGSISPDPYSVAVDFTFKLRK